MTQFDGELSPPFEIMEPAEWRAPIIFNSPHSGSVYPDDFLNASRIDLGALRRSEDSFMDELIAGLSGRGFPVVRVNFPRSYVDVNREPYELDPRQRVVDRQPLAIDLLAVTDHARDGTKAAGHPHRSGVGKARQPS